MKTTLLRSRVSRPVARVASLLLLLAAVFLAGPAAATDFYWSGLSGGSWNIDQGANWFNSGANPASGDNLYFNNTGAGIRTPYCNYGAGAYFGYLITYSGSLGITWEGDKTYLYKFENQDSTTLQSLAFLSNRTGSDTALQINPVNGPIIVTNVIMQNAQQIQIYGGNTLTVNGVISETGTAGSTLVILQGATVVLQQAATYTGDTFANSGTLRLSANNALASGGNYLRLGDTANALSANLNLDGGLGLATPINVRSGNSGTMIIANTSGTSGTATYSGNLYLDHDVTLFANSSGTVALTGTNLDLKAQTLTVDGTGASTISGVLTNSTGSGKLTKNGTGVLTISGVNTYSGLTTLNAGQTIVGNNKAFGTGSITVNSTAQLAVNNPRTLTNAITLNGGIVRNFSTNIALTLSGGVALTADSFFNIKFNDTTALIDITNAPVTGSFGITLTNENNAGGTAGNPVLRLDTVNTYTGPTTISGGTLLIGSAGQLGSGNYAGVITNNGVFNYNSTAVQTLRGVMSGTGSLAESSTGPLTLLGVSTYSGGTTFSGTGTIYVTNDAALGAAAGGVAFTASGTLAATNNLAPTTNNVTIGASRTITVSSGVAAGFSTPDTNSLTVAAYITGAGGVTKRSTSFSLGTVRFNNDTNDYTGDFTAGYGNTEFTSVGNQGTASSLGKGAAASAGLITVANTSSSATLRYVGTNNSATTRPLIWTATTAGGNTLDVTNTGTIAYLNPTNMVAGLGVKTFTLTGSNTGTNTLAESVNNDATNGVISLTKSGTGQWVLTGTNTFTGPTTVAGTLTIGGAGYLGGGIYAGLITNNGFLVYASSVNQTNSGVISATGTLTEQGSGALTLSATNTYTGATTISASTLTISGAGVLGNGIYAGKITNNASLVYASSAIQTNTGVISGTGTLTQQGSGTLTLSGANTFSGSTTITAGTVSISANNNLGANTNGVTLNGGTLQVTAAITGAAYTHTNTIGASGGTLQITAGAGGQFVLNLVGLLTGSGPLNVSGSGTLIDYANTGANFQGNMSIITGANAGYTGVITVTNGGSLELNGGSTAAPYYVLANQGELILDNAFSTPIVANGGVLDFNVNNIINSASITNNTGLTVLLRQFYSSTATYESGTLSGIISGAGGLTVGGANSTGGTLTLSNANTYAGGTTLNTGNTININTATAIGTGAFTVSGNGTFDNTSGGSISNANNNALTMSGGSPTFTGTTNLNFGTGTVTVSGANRTLTVNANTLTLGGGVTDAGGTRTLTKAGAGTLVLNGAAGTWTGGSTLTAGTTIIGTDTTLGTGNLALNGGTLIAGNGARTLANSVTLTASSAIGGTNNLTMNGVFTNSGGSRTLTVANTGATTLAGSVYLSDDNATAGRVLTISNIAPVTISGAISNNNAGNTVAVGLTCLGTNTLTLSGANNYTGSTVVRGGTLVLSGSAKPGINSSIYVVDNNAASTASARVNISCDVNAAQIWMGDRSGSTPVQVGAVFQTAGTLTLSQASSVDNFRLGSVAGGQGYYSLSGGSVSGNELSIGGSLAGTVGVMDITGGTMTTPGWLTVGRGSTTSSGILNVSGTGVVNLTGTLDNTRRLGINWAGSAGAQSVITVSSGGMIAGPTSGVSLTTYTLNLSSANVAGTLGAVNLLTGGTIQIFGVTSGNVLPTSLLNFNGGTLKATTTNANFLTDSTISGVYVYANGATIDDNGTPISVSRPLLAPTGNGVNGIASFTGGAGYVGAPMVTVNRGAGDVTGTGATAIAQIDSSSGGATSGQVTNIVITNPGFNYTATPTFTLSSGGASTAATITGAAPTANTSGGLTKKGSGTLTLTGANTYTGSTIVSAGTLAVYSSLTSTSSITVNDGAVLSVSVSGTNQLSPAALTLGTTTGGTNAFSGITSTTLAPISTAALTLNGVSAINIINVPGVGIYPLIAVPSVANITGSGSVVIGSLPRGVTANIITNGNAIAVNVTAYLQNIWTGSVNTNWDIATTANWKTNGVAANYVDGDLVVFDDTASVANGANNVNIAATVSPGSMTFSNSTLNYTFTNSIVAGSGSLIKNGAGSLSLANANTYAGGTIVNGGTLALGGASPVGVGGPLTLNNGTTVQFNAPTIANNIVVPTGATVSWVNAIATPTLSGNLSGGGTINESGNIGGFTLTGNNSGFTGVMNSANSGSTQRWRFNSYNAGSAAAAWSLNCTATDAYGFAAGGTGTIFFGSLSGSGYFRNDSAGTVTLSVGALNTDTTFSGTIVANTTSILALTKTGTGTFTLTGTANNYNGLTTISGGRLAITPANLAGAGPMSINDNGRLSLTMLGSVPQMSLSTLTLGSVNGCTNEFALVSSTTTAPVFATTLTLAGTNVINIISGGFASGSIYPLIGYTTINGAGGFKIGTVPAGVVATITTNNISGVNTIALNVSTANTTVDVWGGRTSGNWDTSTSGNWTNSGAAVIYADNDNVQFDDTASNFTVTAVSAGNPYLSPGNIVFSNTANAYTLGGSSIALNGTLTKSGANSLTLTTAEIGTGNIAINGGTINLNGPSSTTMLGLGGNISFDGGTIASTAPTANTTVLQNNISVASGKTGTINMSTRTVLGSASITYSLTGAGTLNLNANTTVSRDDIEMAFAAFTGTINFAGTGGVRLFTQAGAFNGFGTATVDIEGSVNLQPQTFSSGSANNWSIGALSGSSTAAGLAASNAGGVTNSIGGNNASTTFAGSIQGNNTVIKVGSGTLTLSGTNTYSGATTVNAGALIGVTGGYCSNSAATINTGATNGVLVSTLGGQWICSNLTYSAGTEYAIFTFNTNSPSTTTAPMLVLSNLTISGTLNIIIGGSGLQTNTYPLIKYVGTLTGAPVLTPLAMPYRTLGYITNDTANKLISLVVTNFTGAANLVWQPGTGLWDNATGNWKNQSAVITSYVDPLDTVLFDETPAGSGPFTVTVNSGFSPVSMTVSNVTKQYTMAGSGIVGTTPLTKNGSGTLVLVNTNLATGLVTINVGRLQLGDGVANNGSVAGNITNNGTLVFAGPANQTYAGVISGTGSMTKTNASTLTLTNANTYSGGTAINAGTVSINLSGGLGTGPLTLGNASGAAATVAVNGLSGPNAASLTNAVTVAGTGLNTISGTWNNSGQINLLPGAITLSSANLTINSTAQSGWRILGGVTGTGNLTFQDNFTGIGAVIDIRSTLNNIGAITNSGTGNTNLTVNGSQSGQIGANVTNLVQNSSTSPFIINAANNSFLGMVQVLLGTMALQNATALNTNLAYIASGATLDIQNVNQTLAGLSDVSGAGGTVNDTTGSSLHTLTLGGSGIYSFSGSIIAATNANRALSVNLTGSGIQTLSGNSTYAGGTTVNGGTLRLGSSLNVLGTGSTIIASGGTLDVNGQTNSTVTSVTGSGVGGNGALINSNILSTALLNSEIVNGAGFTVGGPGSLTLQRVRSGGTPFILTKIGTGTLTLGNASATNHNNLLALDVESASTVNLGMSTYIALDRGLKINAGGTVRYTGSSANMLSDGPEVLVLNGTLDMNGHSDTAGRLTIGDGTNSGVISGGFGSTYTVAANYSLFDVNGTAGTGTIEAMNGSADVILAGSGIPLNKITTNIVILSQANTYSGATAISAGTLALTNAGAIGSTPNIAVSSGALFDVSGVTGSFTLGAAQILSGNGAVKGAMTANGTIAPGLAGISTLTLSNSPALNGTVLMNLNRTNSQNADKLVLTVGTLNYGGKLIVTNLGDTLQNGDTFTLFPAGSYAGGFTNIVLPALTSGLGWNTNTLAVDGSIAVVTTISPTTLALVSSANPSGYLAALTFTATLTPTNATGNVTFFNGATPFSTNSLVAGVATSAGISSLARGTNPITAAYLGGVNFYGSTNTLSQIVTNHPPVANGNSYSRGSFSIWKIAVSDLLANASDADVDTLTLVSVGDSTNGVTLDTTTFSGYVAYYNESLVNDQFTYTVSDGFGGTNSGTITLTAGSSGGVTGQVNSFTVTGGVVNLTFAGIPSSVYNVQRSTNLTDWSTIWTTNAPSGGIFQFNDGSAPTPSAYYRLMW